MPHRDQLVGSGVSLAQLATSASYLAHDLAGIDFSGNDLSGGNFVGQNLTGASFLGAKLSNADLSRARLNNVVFRSATLTGANLSEADARGAFLEDSQLAGAVIVNLIRSDGHLEGFDLAAGKSFLVRDYDGDSTRELEPIVVEVNQHFAISEGGVLQMLFDSDAWDSTISFATGISVSRGGTLELLFADGTNASSQIGRTFKLFDWTGVAPIGAFSVVSPYKWNLSNLYTTGEITLTAIPEPATLVTLLVGVLLPGYRRHMRGS